MSTAPRVVVLSCQWAPHYAFQSLYWRGRRGEGDAVRVLTACVARVGEDVVLDAFRRGAEQVWVLSCPPDACRHGAGREDFDARIARLRRILGTLGIPGERLVRREVAPHEAAALEEELAAVAGGHAEDGRGA